MIEVEGLVDMPPDSDVVPLFPALVIVRVPSSAPDKECVFFEGRILVDRIHLATEMLIDGEDIWPAFQEAGVVGSNIITWLYDVDQKAIVEAMQGISLWIGCDLDAYETLANKWVCAHPGNRAFAARVMAGLSAGL